MHSRAILFPKVGVGIFNFASFDAQNSTRHSIELLNLGLKYNCRFSSENTEMTT